MSWHYVPSRKNYKTNKNNMDIRKVKKLIEMLEESDIGEIEIHEGEESVRISKQGSGLPAHAYVQVPGNQAVIPAGPGAGSGAEGAMQEERVPDGHQVTAPMVGIYYEAPSPGKPPFIELGKSVARGDVLCIIEAMKIMNQVESEVSGVVTRILVDNGDPVEYGQPLFVIREDAGS